MLPSDNGTLAHYVLVEVSGYSPTPQPETLFSPGFPALLRTKPLAPQTESEIRNQVRDASAAVKPEPHDLNTNP
jgi:hypothetical protein